ncbi:MAG: GNAT family N-acetyltransferase [Rhodanobacteraceae bacterium]|nr:GNAT family N-acetyltransferase [Rhodanobacteraceae bacterium]
MRIAPLAANDESLYCELYTDVRLMRHVGMALQREQAERSFRAAVVASHDRPPRHIYFSLVHGATNWSAGICALRDIDLSERCAEIGLILRRRAHATGAAREGLEAVASWAFSELGLARLYGRASADNLAAARVARLAGFSLVRPAAEGAAASMSLFVRFRATSETCNSHQGVSHVQSY